MKSHVTTGQGDSGTTRALNGQVLPKDHPMMEALGALDQLRAQTAMLRNLLIERHPDLEKENAFLLVLLHMYFVIGSAISDPRNEMPQWHPCVPDETFLERLEREQQRLESTLALPRAFIVCASNIVAAQADIATTAAREFERRFVAFVREEDFHFKAALLPWVNRLSDYLFILARHVESGIHQPVNPDVIGCEGSNQASADANSPGWSA